MVVYFPDLTPWHGVAAMGTPVFDDDPPKPTPVPPVRIAQLDGPTASDALPTYAAAVTQAADVQPLPQADFDNRFAPAADPLPSQTLLDPSGPWATGGIPNEPPAAAGIAHDPNAPQTTEQRFNEDFGAPWQTETSRALERFRDVGSVPFTASPAQPASAPPPANIDPDNGSRAAPMLSAQTGEVARIAQQPDAQRGTQYYSEEAKQWLDRFGITDPHMRNVLIERGLIAIGDNAREFAVHPWTRERDIVRSEYNQQITDLLKEARTNPGNLPYDLQYARMYKQVRNVIERGRKEGVWTLPEAEAQLNAIKRQAALEFSKDLIARDPSQAQKIFEQAIAIKSKGPAPVWPSPAEPEVKNGMLSVPGLPIRNATIPGFLYGKDATRNAEPFSAIVSHWTAGSTLQSAFDERVKNPKRPGYHFYIDWDGTVYQGAPLNVRTNHVQPPAVATLRIARPDIANENAIGISVVGDRDKPRPKQLESAKTLAEALMNHYAIPLSNVVGHGEIQSNRQRAEGRALLNALRTTHTGTPADGLTLDQLFRLLPEAEKAAAPGVPLPPSRP